MKPKNRIFRMFLLILLLVSCEDILEEDISGDLVSITFPLEAAIIEGNQVQFSWNNLDGADDYTVQLYNGNLIVLDSTVTNSPFSVNVDSGSYEWRIKASNNGYETQFTFPVSFQVITSADLSNQIVTLSSPSDGLFTNNSSILFTWEDLEAAESYTFQLNEVNTSGTTTIYLEENITTNSLSLDNTIINQDSEFVWGVKAVNSTSQSAFSERTFFLDTTPPPTPSLSTPGFEEEFQLSQTVNFSWVYASDPGNVNSPINSIFEISSDESFTAIIESQDLSTTNSSYLFTAIGTYYWRVRGYDLAGNEGSFNSNGKVIIIE